MQSDSLRVPTRTPALRDPESLAVPYGALA